MTTIYTGSNYGIISTLNSGSGTISVGSSVPLSPNWELVKNYTSGSILINLTTPLGTGWIDLKLQYSNDNSGTIISTEIHRFLKAPTVANSAPITLQFKPQGNYLNVLLANNSSEIITYNIQTRYNNSADPTTSDGVISSANSFNQSLLGNLSINGAFEDISEYALITVLTVATAGTIPGDCTLGCVFSTDGTSIDRVVTYTIQDITSNGLTSNSLTFNPVHTLLPISRYFRLVFTNSSVDLVSLRITTTYHTTKSKALTSRVTQSLTDQYDADTTRSILTGRTIGTILPQGHYQNIGVQNQAIATYIRDPVTAFGELLSANLTPLIQYDFSNGEPYESILPNYRNDTSKTAFTYSNAFLNLEAKNSNAIILSQSSEYTKYKAGQGLEMRMTGVFSQNPVSGCDQFIGLYTPENSLTFGYFSDNSTGGDKFCIRYGRGGVQQISNISIVGASTLTGTITITFTATSPIPSTTVVTASIPSGSSNYTAAAAIMNAINSTLDINIYGWTAVYYTIDNGTTYIVEMIRNIASAPSITVSVSTTTTGYTLSVPATGRAGVSTVYQYIPQSSWNIDRCSNQSSLQQNYLYNASGFNLNPLTGNVYRIGFQYLGFGAITFFVENPETGNFIPVHQIKYVNTSTVTSVTSPNFKMTAGVNNTTNNTSVILKISSFASFTQGAVVPAPLYRSYTNTITANTVTSITKLNSRIIFGFRVLRTKTSTNSDTTTSLTINRSNLFLNSFSAAINTTYTGGGSNRANITFQLVKNPSYLTLGDPNNYTTPTNIYNPQWRQYERDSSIMIFDGSVTTSTSTGVSYTGGLNVIDIPLVEENTITYNLRDMLVNAGADDLYVVTFFGNTSGITSFDTLGAISYQINN